jgi:hypothetical protein
METLRVATNDLLAAANRVVCPDCFPGNGRGDLQVCVDNSPYRVLTGPKIPSSTVPG